MPSSSSSSSSGNAGCLYTFNWSYTVDQTLELPYASTHALLFTVTEATAPVGVTPDSSILVYQREAIDPQSSTYASFFSAVASPNDMAEITATAEPDAAVATPLLFRLTTLTAYFRSRDELETCLQNLLSDIQLLANNLASICSQQSSPITGTISSQ